MRGEPLSRPVFRGLPLSRGIQLPEILPSRVTRDAAWGSTVADAACPRQWTSPADVIRRSRLDGAGVSHQSEQFRDAMLGGRTRPTGRSHDHRHAFPPRAVREHVCDGRGNALQPIRVAVQDHPLPQSTSIPGLVLVLVVRIGNEYGGTFHGLDFGDGGGSSAPEHHIASP